MPGNTFGKTFTVTTFGESHGPALGCIVDGCPPGIELSVEDIQPDLDRRKPGQNRFQTQRRESDIVKILSGVFEGKTTGTSIGLLIENTDAKSSDYNELQHKFRPGHADYTYQQKYGIRDHRGGGRASARETAMRVAAAAIAKKYLKEKCGVKIRGYVSQIGPIGFERFDWDEVNRNDFFFPDSQKVDALITLIDDLRKEGNSVGAKVTVVAEGVPPGLGEPVFDKLDADIAYAMMSINAVKGVEMGAGADAAAQKGTEHRDEMTQEGFLSNDAGGTLGGISSGQPIVTHVSFKPTSSIRLSGRTIDRDGQDTTVETKGRHDPCVGIRGTPIVEAMMALVLMDHVLRHRAQNSDVQQRTPVIAAGPDGIVTS